MNTTRLAIRNTLLSLLLTGSLYQAEAAPQLQLKDHDVWVMAGDSITAQRLHSNYIEAFFRERHPQLNLHFRNSGIGGNRTGSILARFDYDVAAWKPTIVSIELGMNDVNGQLPDYIKGMKQLIAKIRAIPAQPVLISSSPVDDGSLLNDWRSARCEKIHPFTEALKQLAEEENVVFVDQYHPLINLWGENRRKGAELAEKNGTLPPKNAPEPAQPLASGTTASGAPAPAPKAPPIPPSLIPLGGDPVHPGSVGQYNMAAVILAGLNVSKTVSSADISADGKLRQASHCKVTDISAKDGILSFTRLDESSPWGIVPAAKSALTLMPDTVKLSEYLLTVIGLPEGHYQVSLNGKPAAVVASAELSSGWNIAGSLDGFLGERATAINTLISKLQGPLNNAWRAASKANDAEKLAAAQKDIELAEAEIQAAVQPVPIRFDIQKTTSP